MYCRNCSKEVDEKAYVCIHCGVMPKKEKKFCHHCGVAIQVNQDVCVKCGVSFNSTTPISFEGRNRVIAAVLAILLGGFGAHKFYLGYNQEGVVMLAIFLVGLAIMGLPSMVIGVIAIVEGIIYLTKSEQEFQEKYVQKKTGWF